MSIDAIALLRVPYADLCKTQDMTPAANATEAMESTYPFVPVGADATACFLGISFGSEPEDLGAYVRHVAGAAVDAHTDARGVLIVPDVAWKEAQPSYDAAVEHFGEAGQWVARVSESEAHALLKDKMHAMLDAPGLGLGGMAGGLAGLDIGALGAQLGDLQGLLAANPGAAEAAKKALEGMGGGGAGAAPAGLGGMFEAAQAMLAQMSPEQRAQIEQMAKAAFGMGTGGGGNDDGKK
ncbi:MAG: hypothetical protein HOO96_42425 [Polyangiaceae bacterium]|nr:hypothetical protein [Polyangiaceae bacterium]